MLYSLHRLDELMAAIRANTLPLLLGKYRQTYESGAPVRFGPINMDCFNGVTVGKKHFDVNDIRVSIEDGQVKIKSGKRALPWGGAGVAVKKVPNLDVFLALLPGSGDDKAGS